MVGVSSPEMRAIRLGDRAGIRAVAQLGSVVVNMGSEGHFFIFHQITDNLFVPSHFCFVDDEIKRSRCGLRESGGARSRLFHLRLCSSGSSNSSCHPSEKYIYPGHSDVRSGPCGLVESWEESDRGRGGALRGSLPTIRLSGPRRTLLSSSSHSTGIGVLFWPRQGLSLSVKLSVC